MVDEFTASNQFHGLLIGVAGEYRMNYWFVKGRAALSFGGTFREATISGATSVHVPPLAPVTLPGGLLALSSNSGTFSESDWVFAPEASLRVGYQVSSNLRAYMGYAFLYWPGVYRAANQIDPVVNPSLIPPREMPICGPVRPLFPDRQSSSGYRPSRSAWNCATDVEDGVEYVSPQMRLLNRFQHPGTCSVQFARRTRSGARSRTCVEGVPFVSGGLVGLPRPCTGQLGTRTGTPFDCVTARTTRACVYFLHPVGRK